MSKVSSKEKFDELKLLKELFYIEKDGSPNMLMTMILQLIPKYVL